jgi:hypothetical protein
VSKAQISDNYFRYENYKSVVEIDGDYEFNSSSITNKFLNNYLYGSRIDSLPKQWMFRELKQKNTFGSDEEGGLSFLFSPDTLFGNTSMSIFVKYNKYYHIDLSFTDDLFELFFDGNKRFAGKNVDLSHSSLNVLNYDQIQFGIQTKFGGDKITHTFGIGLSINNGYKNLNINIPKGNIFTDANAEYIDFSANYEVSMSDTSHTWLGTFKGLGTSINLYYSFKTKNNNCFNFQITDLGFIRWAGQSQQFSKDTTIHFEGVNVTDILNVGGNIFGNFNTDSIVHSYIFSKTTRPYTMLTPACLKISYLYNFSEKIRTEFSANQKFFVHYDPFFLLKTQYLPDKRNIISLNLCYGGYGGLNIREKHEIDAGFEYSHNFGKGLIILAGSNYLNGILFPYSITAQGAFLSIKKYFF